MNRPYNVRPIPNPAAPQQRRRSLRMPLLTILIVLLALTVAYVIYAAVRPLATPKIVITPPVTPALVEVKVPWPHSAPAEQSAYGAEGYGLLDASSKVQTPSPTASVAKIITILCVLQKHPLQPGESGPTITLTNNDVAIYNKYVAEDGSVVPVTAGESITEYQALQAMLLPSANNIADTMADWAFGDMGAYTAYANQYVKTLGMDNTTVTDASGFTPTTVSTASDLVRLGGAAVDNPVITEIADQSRAQFPGYGTIYTTNLLLDQSGINGLKTGNTDQAGGVFLAIADASVGGKTIHIITAVMGAPTLNAALRDTLPLVQSAPSLFETVHVLQTNQNVGKLTTSWGETANITASKPIDVVAWTGTTIPALTAHSSLRLPAIAGETVGSLSLKFQGTTQTAPLKLADDLNGPSLGWRLAHPF